MYHNYVMHIAINANKPYRPNYHCETVKYGKMYKVSECVCV